MKTPYYESLDGLRAVAVAIVLLAHAHCPYFISGGVGVDIFFVLSGFLITSILVSEHQQHSRISFRNFYFRRFLRLAPCLILTCILVLSLNVFLAGEPNWIPVFVALSNCANWIRAYTEIELGSLAHCWSLAIEEQYYLIWPGIIAFVCRCRNSHTTNAIVFVVLSLGLAFYRYLVVDYFSIERIHFGLDTHIDGIILGSAVAFIVFHLRERIVPNVILCTLSYVLVPLAIFGIAFITFRIPWWNPMMAKYGYTLIAFGSATLIADLVLSKRSLIKHCLEQKALVYLGKISYGLYLLHFPVFVFLDSFFEGEVSPSIAITSKILVSITVAYFSYRFFEFPFLKLKRYFKQDS